MTSPLGITRQILLSFDVEEFDLPLEFGQQISEVEQFKVTARGLLIVLEMLDQLGISATFFTTANFALNHQDLIRIVARKHEVASHCYTHGGFHDGDLLSSRVVLEEIVGLPIRGFRRPRLRFTDHAWIRSAGYDYNSSDNPIFLPGRYNNLFRHRTVHLSAGLLNIPISATPWIRFPLFWLSFKNVPLQLMKAATAWTLNYDSYINIFYHPWEFVDLKPYHLPSFVRRIDADTMKRRFENYLVWLQARGQFVTFSTFAANHARLIESQT